MFQIMYAHEARARLQRIAGKKLWKDVDWKNQATTAVHFGLHISQGTHNTITVSDIIYVHKNFTISARFLIIGLTAIKERQ